jgi:non-ribosomal peptide synthetase component E (peptide arylation enzyme)
MQINNFLEDAAWKFPDNKAVWYKGCWTSYGQIDVLANKLANYLKEIGISRVKPGRLMFPCMPRRRLAR